MKWFLSLFAAIILLAFPALAGSSSYQSKVNYDLTATVTIATSDTTTQAVDLYGTQLVGIFVPSTFDGTAMTLTASSAIDGTYVAVDIDHTSASAYTITTAASKYVPIANLDITEGLRYFKIVTTTQQATTNTVFTLATKAR